MAVAPTCNGLRRYQVETAHGCRWGVVIGAVFAMVAIAVPADAVVVRYEFSLNGTDLGVVDVRLFQSAMPNTVANFLNYVNDDDWDGSFIHRRAAVGDSGVAVIQGGGFYVPETGLVKVVNQQLMVDFELVPTDAAINDEPGGGVAGPSNLRGTIAMAKSGPNTAKGQWYFNTIDNTVLNNPLQSSGGFSAFGRVLGNGMTVIDNIWQLPIVNVNLSGSPFTHLPVLDANKVVNQVDVFSEDVVLVDDVRLLDIPAGDYDFNGTVNMADYNVWKNTFGSITDAAADGNGNGIVDAADYTLWRDTLGQTRGVGGGSIGTASPEPASASLLLLAGALLPHLLRRR